MHRWRFIHYDRVKLTFKPHTCHTYMWMWPYHLSSNSWFLLLKSHNLLMSVFHIFMCISDLLQIQHTKEPIFFSCFFIQRLLFIFTVHPAKGPLRDKDPCGILSFLTSHVSLCSWSVFPWCFSLALRPPGSRSGFTIQISTSVAKQGGEQFASPRGPLGCLSETHHAWRAPHFNGGVVAGRQQQLLVCWAEGHRVDHVIMFQARQADVVVPVPDVTVLVLCTTTQTFIQSRQLTLQVQLWLISNNAFDLFIKYFLRWVHSTDFTLL